MSTFPWRRCTCGVVLDPPTPSSRIASDFFSTGRTNSEKTEVASFGHVFLLVQSQPYSKPEVFFLLFVVFVPCPSLLFARPAPRPPQDARLWYGIGLLYDCYGSYGHAIEAFDACLKMDPNFELDHEASLALELDRSCRCFLLALLSASSSSYSSLYNTPMIRVEMYLC